MQEAREDLQHFRHFFFFCCCCDCLCPIHHRFFCGFACEKKDEKKMAEINK